MHTFANKGPENTQTTLKLALEKANELQTSLVIATNTGQSVQGLLDLMKECRLNGPSLQSVMYMACGNLEKMN